MYFLQTLQFRISQDAAALDLLLQAKHLRVPVASRDESATLKVVEFLMHMRAAINNAMLECCPFKIS